MEVLNITEACQYLRIAKVTLYRYIRRGEIPAFKMGRVWKFHKESLEQWVKDRVQTDTKALSDKESS
jgi:excisionase family DNA binding protein